MIAKGESFPLANGVAVVRAGETVFRVLQRGKELKRFRTWEKALQFADKTAKESSEAPPPRLTYHVDEQRMNKSTDVPHRIREGIASVEDAKRVVLKALADEFPGGYFVELFTDTTLRVKAKRSTWEYRIGEDE